MNGKMSRKILVDEAAINRAWQYALFSREMPEDLDRCIAELEAMLKIKAEEPLTITIDEVKRAIYVTPDVIKAIIEDVTSNHKAIIEILGYFLAMGNDGEPCNEIAGRAKDLMTRMESEDQ